MITQHTPGPWSIRPGPTIIRVGDETAPSVALVSRQRDEWEANARLIAAAPDLLASLIECRQLLDNLQNRQLLVSSALGGHLIIDNRYEITIAEAAIAKAGAP